MFNSNFHKAPSFHSRSVLLLGPSSHTMDLKMFECHKKEILNVPTISVAMIHRIVVCSTSLLSTVQVMIYMLNFAGSRFP